MQPNLTNEVLAAAEQKIGAKLPREYIELLHIQNGGYIRCDGYWHLCLDYRENRRDPRVTWISTESDREEPIAGSFAEYLDQLTLDIDETFVLET